MHRFAILILALAQPLLCHGAETMFPVPRNATSVSHVVIQPGVAEQDYFWLKERYPSSSAMTHYSQLFLKWRPCYAGDRGWWSFGDMSSGTPTLTHQFVRYWVNRTNDAAVTVFLKYSSLEFLPDRRPDNDQQFVGVLRHTVPNALDVIEQMGAKCEPGP